MLCRNTFLAIIHIKIEEGQILTIFHIWSHNELVTMILGFRLETVLIRTFHFNVKDE